MASSSERGPATADVPSSDPPIDSANATIHSSSAEIGESQTTTLEESTKKEAKPAAASSILPPSDESPDSDRSETSKSASDDEGESCADGGKNAEAEEAAMGAEEAPEADAKETSVADDASAPPPLPDEPLPDAQDDDGWDPMWSEEHQAWYFFNRFTQQTQWENPRVPDLTGAPPGGGAAVAGGYNPAIHGDYDPNAWYAKGATGAGGEDGAADENDEEAFAAAAAAAAAVIQNSDPSADGGVGGGEYRYGHDAKAGRQMNAYFDVTAAAGAHDGRSLKAERSGKKPTRSELKAFREKRRARKEEKRRAWLRD